jgi:hypothetical protein
MKTVTIGVGLLVAGLSFVVLANCVGAAAGQDKELKIIAQVAPLDGKPDLPTIGGMKGNTTGTSEIARIARSREDLAKTPEAQQKLEARLVELFKVKSIDWQTQMVIQVIAGGARTERVVQFQSLSVKDKSLTVHWKIRDTGKFRYTIITGMALVPRFDGEVRFVEK